MEYFIQKKEEKKKSAFLHWIAGSKHSYFTDVLHFPPLNLFCYVIKDTRKKIEIQSK